VVEYFAEGGALQVSDDSGAEACVRGFQMVPGLLDIVASTGLATPSAGEGRRAAACELVLEALVARKRISRSDQGRYLRAPHEGSGGGGGPKGKGFQGFDPTQF
jgi:magnesium chelatase subunit I